jgi:hypothetical protein
LYSLSIFINSSIGAVAQIADAACLPESDDVSAAQYFYDVWIKAPKRETPLSLFAGFKAVILGQHEFVNNPTGAGTIARWDFSSKGDIFPRNPNAYVEATRVANLSAPTGKTDIDWLELKGVAGNLADKAYRVDTKGGQPPATCNPQDSEVLSVKYTAIYGATALPFQLFNSDNSSRVLWRIHHAWTHH